MRWEDFFHWFLMEGVSKEFNEIYLELVTEHLFRAVENTGNVLPRSSSQPVGCCPGLMVAVELLLPTGRICLEGCFSEGSRKISQSLEIIPVIYLFVYFLSICQLLRLKNTVERMVNMSNQVLVEANLNGKLNSSIETDVVCIKSYF